ncbi:MAG: hypothetical protein AVDCRST_MAG16-3087, partial [uncultured Frankineae bacterium]
ERNDGSGAAARQRARRVDLAAPPSVAATSRTGGRPPRPGLVRRGSAGAEVAGPRRPRGARGGGVDRGGPDRAGRPLGERGPGPSRRRRARDADRGRRVRRRHGARAGSVVHRPAAPAGAAPAAGALPAAAGGDAVTSRRDAARDVRRPRRAGDGARPRPACARAAWPAGRPGPDGGAHRPRARGDGGRRPRDVPAVAGTRSRSPERPGPARGPGWPPRDARRTVAARRTARPDRRGPRSGRELFHARGM